MIKFKVETAKLKEVIRSVKKGISKAKSVAECHRGINFIAEDGLINIITCDGHKAFSNILPITDGERNFNFSIPLFRIPTESNVETEFTIDVESKKLK